MAIDERSRHDLFVRLESVLGPDEAATLMEHLPPVGWADVATKHDLDQLETRIGLQFDVSRRDFEIRLASSELALRDRMDTQFRTTVFAVMFSLVAAILSLAGLAR